MGKITNVVLNSNNAVSGSTSNNATFFVDWGAILDDRKAYKLHWTYIGGNNAMGAATKVAQVRADFQTRQYLNKSSTLGAPTTQTIGNLRFFAASGTLAYLFADDGNNPPVYLESRPYNNMFQVSIYDNAATPALWTDTAAAVPAAWMLTLSFQEVDEYDED